MAILTDDIKKIINDKSTLKVIASIDKSGVPHVVFKGSLHVNEEDRIVYYELLESSRSNQNLVHSIWFDKLVAVNVLSEAKESYEILCRPIRSITSGREFEAAYKALIDKRPDDDLGAIWILEPIEAVNETYSVKRKEQQDNYPIINHLDKYVSQ